MDVRPDIGDRIATLHPEGELTGTAATALKEEVRARLFAGEDVVLDLSGVVFTDSEGLSALVAAFKTAAGENRRLVLSSLRPNLKVLLELTRLHRVFEVHPDPAAARAALGGETVG